jgi:hypothetical protein
MKRSLVLTLTALATIGILGTIAIAAEPQFRDTITVRGMVRGPGVGADHLLTFSGPVALPGISLGAGTYVFARPSANVLQVLSSDRRHPYAMLLTVATTRADSIDSYQIVLGPRMAEGAPRRIEAWFVPGESTGQELIYPKR